MRSAKSNPAEKQPGAPSRSQARIKIDEIDGAILKLLQKRMRVARDVGESKASEARLKGRKSPNILVPEREEEIYRRLRREAETLGMPWPLVQSVYVDIIGLCCAAQGQITAHVLGPAGTHSEWAARARLGAAVAIRHHDSIPTAIKAAELAVVGGDPNAIAVVPIENSLEGTVAATVDSMLSTSLKLIGEGFYRVRHALLTKASGLTEIRTIYSHPMALAQCQRWVREHVPQAKLNEVASTAEAARLASESGRTVAAIASPYLAGGPVRALVSDIQDSIENTTRFGVFGSQVPGPSGDDKTSLVFSLPNKAGALVAAIDTFSKHKLNMTKIESRPHKGLQWEYLFYVDIDGHAFDPKVTRALEDFDRAVRYFKILGTYPKGRPWN